jgi:hypothetical protein
MFSMAAPPIFKAAEDQLLLRAVGRIWFLVLQNGTGHTNTSSASANVTALVPKES